MTLTEINAGYFTSFASKGEAMQIAKAVTDQEQIGRIKRKGGRWLVELYCRESGERMGVL